MPDQGMISREELYNRMVYQKVELESCLNKAMAIEDEINEIEDKLYSKGDSLENYMSCHNQPVFAEKKCKLCVLFKRCVYRSKEDYGRFKL